ncbi:hypothetical protein L249_3602 [Ophiocordyceps polyrhachis-furcata BCC 54312]|uniref:Uncharacterized protein n=1 Tax=Ophiocordyceps polyrhachis-furcata BCC 54312 TaxID=1330021 RepID=A0A367LMI8_9HYPO|nr:hypothetical protein L249_3602 [Ophiocordyceps polyrhachis-furcata BCC 54312]
MNAAHMRQRSASHGSLNSAYTDTCRAHGRLAAGTTSTIKPSSQRRPLRSVNENAALLRSPGPLESMLKKTTETGDIGVFTIRASIPPPTRQRSRSHVPDAGLVSGPPAKMMDDGRGQDEQRYFRSYRDTTSEIISLYGSDNNQQHWLSSSASPFADDGHRSYSLTTCSSHQIPSQKSSGTLQSQSSGGYGSLGRSRSPLPYPTRLKRPGIRTPSQALVDNGSMDYGRMGEYSLVLWLAYASSWPRQRAAYGVNKYPHGSRRPPPLSIRADVNRSTASLPSGASPSPYNLGPGHIRSPSSSISGRSRPHDRHRGSSVDHSPRSASLTSIVEMYQRPATASSGVAALRPGGSFYYDYTEEFEKPAPLVPRTEFQAPLCPVPQRAGDGSRHMVLREDSQARLDAISSGRGRGHVAATRTDRGLSTPADEPRAETHDEHHHLGHSGDSMDKLLAGPSRPGIAAASDNGPAVKESASEPRVTDDAEAQACPPVLECAQDDVKLQPGRRGVWLLPKPFAAEADFPQNKPSSLIKPRNTLDPSLSEFASLFSSFDRLAKSPLSHGDGETSTTRIVYCPPSNIDDLDNDYVDSDDQGDCGDGEKNEEDDQVSLDAFVPKHLTSRPSLQLFDDFAAEDQARNRRHRRNGAALRINTAGLGDVAGSRQQLSPPKEELTMICPEPISPARQLKVTKSVPQLMKALPPLPGEATGTSGREGTRGHQTGKQSRDFRVRDSLKSDDACIHPSWKAPETSPPKLKLRVKAASSSGAVSDLKAAFGSGDREGQWNSNAAVKPKLKLKVSRSRLGQANRLKQCNSLADLAVRGQEVEEEEEAEAEAEAEVGAGAGAEAGVGAEAEVEANGERNSLAGWESREGDSSGSDQFNIAYPPCADKSELLQRRSSLPSKDAARSFTWEAERRGLRQKLSMFRLRLTRGPTKEAEDSKTTTDAAAVTDGSDQARGRAISSTRSERVGGRVRRWASDAKQAVRLYVRRRLDGSSRMSG